MVSWTNILSLFRTVLNQLEEIAMTLEKSVTDDQLGKFYRRMSAIASRLGKSLSYGDVMNALQHLHDGTLRISLNSAEDLQQLLQRPLGAENILIPFRETEIPVFSEKPFKDCFTNKSRFPRGFTLMQQSRQVLFQVRPGKLRVQDEGYGELRDACGRVLQVSSEIPTSWLQQLLVRRGHTLTLAAVEGIIELHAKGEDIGLAPLSDSSKICFYPGNLAFVEVWRGHVDMVHFNWKTPKRWEVSLYPFDQGGESRRDDTHLDPIPLGFVVF
jgi:hypothetical protein